MEQFTCSQLLSCSKLERGIPSSSTVYKVECRKNGAKPNTALVMLERERNQHPLCQYQMMVEEKIGERQKHYVSRAVGVAGLGLLYYANSDQPSPLYGLCVMEFMDDG